MESVIWGCVPAALHAHSSRGKGGFEISCWVHLPKTPLKRLSIITPTTTTTTPLSDHSGLHIFSRFLFQRLSAGAGSCQKNKHIHPVRSRTFAETTLLYPSFHHPFLSPSPPLLLSSPPGPKPQGSMHSSHLRVRPCGGQVAVSDNSTAHVGSYHVSGGRGYCLGSPGMGCRLVPSCIGEAARSAYLRSRSWQSGTVS